MGKELSETRLQYMWYAEPGYYFPGFRRSVDLKEGIAPETPVMPLLMPTGVTEPLAGKVRNSSDNQAPQVARVLRTVTEDNSEQAEKG